MTTYRVCCFLRRFRAASNEPSEAVGDVFRAYADGGGGLLGEEALRRFLREVQRETDAGADAAAKEVVAFAAEHRLLSKGRGLTAEGFLRWLFSDANAALDPRRGVYQDMGLPLSHYFIYTGHNSYLTGNQLSSGCSERPIVKALHDGVRVIELDLWPNAAKDDVEVLHGRTWTSPVELIRCLEAIKEHAFATSPYPVILTLEDHLNRDLQAKVAKMLKETFGEMLYVSESEHMAEFPSPDELKGKIVISTKAPKEYFQTKSSKDAAATEEEEGVWGEEITDDKATARQVHAAEPTAHFPAVDAHHFVQLQPADGVEVRSPDGGGKHAGPREEAVADARHVPGERRLRLREETRRADAQQAVGLRPESRAAGEDEAEGDGVHGGRLAVRLPEDALRPVLAAGLLRPGGGRRGAGGHEDGADAGGDGQLGPGVGPRVRAVPAGDAGAGAAAGGGARVGQPPEGRVRRPDLPARVGAPPGDPLRQAVRPQGPAAALRQAAHALRLLPRLRLQLHAVIDIYCVWQRVNE
uniref:Phosphoinositide phospholipase C n=1 Tax=Zea mays TaxID=4577 RepID=A0A804R9W6_MAIZE